MDIQYLHALQQLRESLPDFIEKFFVLYSIPGDGPGLIALALIVYWCVDKRTGEFTALTLGVSTFASQLLKNIACVYRPWVRDATIVPAADAVEGATGYSFPSGHVTGTAATFGSFAWLMRKKHRVFAVVCIAIILVMIFARNFLGLHTPQDVLAGLLIALISIALTQMFLNWIERYDALMPGHSKDILAMVVALVLSVAAIALVTLKPYPMDYVDGVLLVDPVSMQKGTFEGTGLFAGLAVAWVLERRFVGFSTDGLVMKQRVVRGVVGVGLVGITYVLTDVAFKALLPYNWAKLVAYFFVILVAVFVAPFVFNKLENRR